MEKSDELEQYIRGSLEIPTPEVRLRASGVGVIGLEMVAEECSGYPFAT
jgi:hypothetical protein